MAGICGAVRSERRHLDSRRVVSAHFSLAPGYPEYDLQLRELEEASAALGQKINILRVATAHDVDTAFTALVQQRALVR